MLVQATFDDVNMVDNKARQGKLYHFLSPYVMRKS